MESTRLCCSFLLPIFCGEFWCVSLFMLCFIVALILEKRFAVHQYIDKVNLQIKLLFQSCESALIIHKILQNKPAFMLNDEIYYSKMKSFTLQILHRKNVFYFHGLGLFILDYTFIFSVRFDICYPTYSNKFNLRWYRLQPLTWLCYCSLTWLTILRNSLARMLKDF